MTDDQITNYAADARSNMTKLTTPDSNYADMVYDNQDRLTTVRDLTTPTRPTTIG